jgi:hypothetical protein
MFDFTSISTMLCVFVYFLSVEVSNWPWTVNTRVEALSAYMYGISFNSSIYVYLYLGHVLEVLYDACIWSQHPILLNTTELLPCIMLRPVIIETRVPVSRPRLLKFKSHYQDRDRDQDYWSCSLTFNTETKTMNLKVSVTRLKPRPRILVSMSRLTLRRRLNAINWWWFMV